MLVCTAEPGVRAHGATHVEVMWPDRTGGPTDPLPAPAVACGPSCNTQVPFESDAFPSTEDPNLTCRGQLSDNLNLTGFSYSPEKAGH